MRGLGSCHKGLADAKMVAREKYAWPGGYALWLITADGGILCPECIRNEWPSIVRYTLWGQRTSGWFAEGAFYTESSDEPETCDHCGRVIE